MSGPSNSPDAPLHPDWYNLPTGDNPRQIDPSYPDLPFHSYQSRPAHPHNQLRREFGEPVPEQYEVLSVQSFDIETTYSMSFMLASLGGFIGSMALLRWAWQAYLDPHLNQYRIPVVKHCSSFF